MILPVPRPARGLRPGPPGRVLRPSCTVSSQQLQDITDRTLRGELDTKIAAVVSQLLNVKLRAVEIGRKIKETEELEARLEELERRGA